jgi:peptidoglycan/LPS O-acetylase OafA/YrhL
MGPTLTAIATTALIVCFDTGPNHSGQLVARLGKRTEVFGLLTYAIYVWHEPILIAAAKIQPRPETLSLALQSLGTSCVVILAVSIVMNYAIERPFERMKSHARSAGPAQAQTLRLSDVRQDAAPPSATPATELRRSA